MSKNMTDSKHTTDEFIGILAAQRDKISTYIDVSETLGELVGVINMLEVVKSMWDYAKFDAHENLEKRWMEKWRIIEKIQKIDV